MAPAELQIRTAADLLDSQRAAWWAARRARRASPLMQHILRGFVERGEAIGVDAVVAAFPADAADEVREALAALDAEDLIQIRAGLIQVAYPFSASPTSFVAVWPDGRQRYACCAIDALALASMVGVTVGVRSRCHHCQERVDLAVSPDGPEEGSDGIMVWIGDEREGACRLITGL